MADRETVAADRGAVRETRMLLADIDPTNYPDQLAQALGTLKTAADHAHRLLRAYEEHTHG